MTKRRMTKTDWDNIISAMTFCDAGEFPFTEGMTTAQADRFLKRWDETKSKVWERRLGNK